MTMLADDIRARGLAAIEDLLTSRAEETLHIEFKSLKDNSGEQIVKDDRSLLARAVCGMANAEGGTIIVGIKSAKLDRIDVASTKEPIGNCTRFRNLVVAALPDWLSSQHPGIEVFAVEGEPPPAGYVIVKVPASDDRPHMSNLHHQYFRRGSDGTRVLEHDEVRELMLGARHGALDIKLYARQTSRTGLAHRMDLILVLVNAGRVAVRAPYIKFDAGNGPTWRNATSSYEERRLISGYGVYSMPGVVVHVADENLVATLEYGISFSGPNGTGAQNIAHIQSNYDDLLFSVGRWETVRDAKPGTVLGGGGLKVAGIFGGENAPARKFDFARTKRELFDLFAPKIT
ncbi:ATP-binding protein [Bradyrhizobium sp. B097]|uniref:AlbA family DNA-binding domain-containing protein n=1 Tax=Bradyrhizobium sp. B097 TaxID=3140244 RepID=UPI003184283F